MQKLMDFKEPVIWRGAVLKCDGAYPYESTVYFLICEMQERYAMMCISGYKAGLIYTLFPDESKPRGNRFGLSTDWLKVHWDKFGYPDCDVENVCIASDMSEVLERHYAETKDH